MTRKRGMDLGDKLVWTFVAGVIVTKIIVVVNHFYF